MVVYVLTIFQYHYYAEKQILVIYYFTILRFYYFTILAKLC
jgi:hypothetical protein